MFFMLTLVLSSEHRAGAQGWGWDMEDPIPQSLGLVSRLTSQAVCTPVLQTSEALLSLVLGTELRVVLKSCAERCPKSGTQPRGLSVT